MKRKIIQTGDGSPTIYVENLNEHYHSVFGARAESEHIFINAGLNYLDYKNISILEIGFGTGLNTYLTLNMSMNRKIRYYAIEKYPLEPEEWDALIYAHEKDPFSSSFREIHSAPWGEWVSLNPGFELFKEKTDLKDFTPPPGQDLIYFDAFAPEVQPGLWTESIFQKLYECMKKGGVLLTYSVKGSVRKSLKNCGFDTEKLPGPTGKRHILRASK
jgi:tRNA U34 5-methylaminomethyl-2-thiouridine-forming methyltransferase MnmC